MPFDLSCYHLTITRFRNTVQVFAIRYAREKLLVESSRNNFYCAQIRRPLSRQISSAQNELLIVKHSNEYLVSCSQAIFDTSKGIEFPREMSFLTRFSHKRVRAVIILFL